MGERTKTFLRSKRTEFELSFTKMILEVLFDRGSTGSKEIKLEALNVVKKRYIIMSQRFICDQDPESLSKKEEGSDCQRFWNLVLEKGTSPNRW